MPWNQVMSKWKAGELHSGSDKGPAVKGKNQAVAIMLSEKREAAKGKKEYQPKKYDEGGDVKPSAPDSGTSSYNPAYDKMPQSTHIQDERMGPQQDITKPLTIDEEVRVDKQGYGHGVVSKEGQHWAAKNLPKKLPTAPMKDDKAELGDIKQSPQYKMAGMETTKYPSGLKADYVPYQSKTTPEQLKAYKSYQKETGPNVFAPPEAYTPPSKSVYRKGGPMKRYDEGGDVKPDTPTPPPRPTPPKPPSRPNPLKDTGDDTSAPSAPKEMPTSSVSTPPMVEVSPKVPQVRKGGPIGKFDKGGKVCASNAKQFKQNIVETAVNPTEPIGFNKGGEVGWKKPSWRRW